MSEGQPRIPRSLRGTDLQAAYLEGFEEGRAGKRVSFGEHKDYCRAEWDAHRVGFTNGQRQAAEGAE